MVNTFLPYSNFQKVAKILDRQRLGKQRVEAKQLINILTDATNKKGWRNHPAVKMWKGYTDALKYYYNTIVKEWIERGYENNMAFYKIPKKIKIPWFVKNKSLNLTHQASLLRKYPAYYKKIFKPPPPPKYMIYTYIWPSDLTKDEIKELKKKKDKIADVSKYAKVYAETAAAKALARKIAKKKTIRTSKGVVSKKGGKYRYKPC